jgi:hypothetical protein
MKLTSAGNQSVRHPMFCADGTITTGGTPQLVLARSQSRSYLLIENKSTGNLLIEIGSARATATLTSGAISSIAVTNAGMGFTYAPVIRFLGGGNAGNSSNVGLGQPGGEAPNSMMGAGRVATAHCVMSGSAGALTVASITVNDGGIGYVAAPYVQIFNSDLDPLGVATPSATVGILLEPGGGAFCMEGTVCTTDAVSIYGATTGQAFVTRWMD